MRLFTAAASVADCWKCGTTWPHSNRLRLQNGERCWTPAWAGKSGVWSKKEMVLPELREENIVSLGEGNSPLIRSDAFARLLGFESVHIKQCGTSHTGSFKTLA